MSIWIKKANVLVHVENVLVGETFDIFGDGNNLLEILILPVRENRVINNDAVNGSVIVCRQEAFFDEVFGNGEESEFDAAECV